MHIKNISRLLVMTLCSLFLSSCGEPQEQIVEKSYIPEVTVNTTQVGVSRTFETTGEVVPYLHTSLSTDFKSVVEKIYVKEGDEVKKGELLVKLENPTIETQLETQKSTFESSKSQLESTQTASEKNILSAQVALENARLNLQNVIAQNVRTKQQALDNARLSLENTELSYNNTLSQNDKLRIQAEERLTASKLTTSLSVESAQVGLQTAEENLENARIQATKSEERAQLQLQSALDNIVPSLQNLILDFDAILGVTEEYEDFNNAFEQVLGARKLNALNKAKSSLELTIDQFTLFKLQTTITYNESYKLLDQIEETTILLRDTIDNTVISFDYPQSLYQTHTALVSSSLTTVRSLRSSLKNAQTSLESTLATNNTSIVTAQNGVKQAKTALENAEQKIGDSSQIIINAEAAYNETIERLHASETSAKKALESAKTSYSNVAKVVEAQVKASEDAAKKQVELAQIAVKNAEANAKLSVVSAKSSVNQAEGSFDRARIDQEKLLIMAPFEGIVSELNVEMGDEIAPNTPIVNVENNTSYKVIVYVPKEQQEYVQRGDTVMINGKINGTIASISNSADAVTKKYKVEIYSDDTDLEVLAGTFAKVLFSISYGVSTKQQYVPITAVQLSPTENYLWLVEKVQEEDIEKYILKRQVVTIGQVDGDYVEVTSGLEPGLQVVTKGGRVFSEEDEGKQVTIVLE